ncbi:uncharacterized protein EURHEDRAFT_541240 [Aspergillus ruber CBS 135680]|uniref:Uncharacterized protein n=1 Tax=Aspergillus ruber (strain CBS 135680) TaxID=1388766 RepID=A0A017SQT6_ASPRC|nr:uncharacterized protein EURHEDRAFT_541240 [Aspergillus ruber CBS 135680]EYE99337.1 hypothetical protein EURHEDRAFT_541240 [Aspergillus ruber CBS 135680]
MRIPEHEHQKLADAQQQLLDYRSWATLNWWDAVFTRTSLPQGTDKESTLARVSRVAEMGEQQILTGPWFVLCSVPQLLKVYKFLILSSMLTYFINSFDLHSHTFETKRITAEKSKIHESIIQEVLESFVDVPESAIPDLERIFNIIIAAIEAKSQVSNNLAHLNVSNTLEYSMGNIRSVTQTTLFLITYETVQFNTQKGEADHVEFTISYSQAQGGFSNNKWKSVVEQFEIEENERQAMNGYVEERTVDVAI